MTMNILNISTFHEPSLYSPLLSLHLLLPQTYPKSWFLDLFYFSYLFSCKSLWKNCVESVLLSKHSFICINISSKLLTSHLLISLGVKFSISLLSLFLYVTFIIIIIIFAWSKWGEGIQTQVLHMGRKK